MIYLKPGNLYPKEDRRISCMYFEEFTFTPQVPVAMTHGIFGGGFGTSDIQQLLAAVTSGLENASSERSIDLKWYNSSTHQGTPI